MNTSADPGMLSIRPYGDGDRDAVVALWKSCGLVTSWNDPDEDIALVRRTASSEIFLGERGRHLTAAMVIGHDGHRGWVYYLAVDPNLRGRGYGGQILRHGERWLADQGVPKVQLLIRDTNLGVKVFYGRLGYQPNTCEIMQRWLDGRNAPGIETERDDGRIEITITYLEMSERPAHPHVVPPLSLKLSLLRAHEPTVGFYRFLYNSVGAPWLWYERRLMEDDDLARIIHDERVEVYVLYVNGVPAGYAELDLREPPDIELAYFGLIPDFIGRGLGRFLLTWAIDTAWNHEPQRLWVNTNTLDHPKALPLYQRCGFRPYRQDHLVINDPRILGVVPA